MSDTIALERARVGVVGCGLMGSGIAEVCARAGLDVVVAEADAARRRGRAAAASRPRSPRRVEPRQARPRPTATPRSAGSRSPTDLGEFADRQLVVEAVAEDEAAQDRRLPHPRQGGRRRRTPSSPRNTSSIPIMKLADGHRAGPSRSSASTSSTRCRCSRSSSWSRRCSPRRRPPSAPRRFATDDARQARDPLARTAPASSSTRC